MGWTFSYRQATDVKREIEHNQGLFVSSSSHPDHIWEVVDSAIVGNTYYAAVAHVRPGIEPYTFCAVILFKNPKSGFGYKDMDESMGPNEVACPMRIFNKLSPLEDFPGGAENTGYSREWRERVLAYHAAKAKAGKVVRSLKAGDTIKIAEPLSFGKSAFVEDTFVIVTMKVRGRNKTYYRSVKTNSLCRVPKMYLDNAVKVL